MKNFMKITSAAILVLFIPFSLVSAQEKKTEKQIKIITNDGSGNHVVIDTLITGNSPDSLKLKDGSVVYIMKDDNSDLTHVDGKHHIVIASTSNSSGDDIFTKEITVIQGDSALPHTGDNRDVIIYNNSPSGDMQYKVVRKYDGTGDQMYYIKNDNDGGSDKSRFVIAKDGMVVTVEGTDEAKTEALAKEIREKLGVKEK